MNMKKVIFITLLFLLMPIFPKAQATEGEEIFQADVLDVMEIKRSVREDGSEAIQQKLELRAVTGSFKGQSIIFDGLEHEVVSVNEYAVGDRIVVNSSIDSEGNNLFYVIDYVRSGKIYWLAVIFAIFVILVGKLKGFRALVVLFLTFVIILKFIIPSILNGSNPLTISIIGAFGILLLSIYLTEGFNRNSTIAVGAVLFSLVITGVLANWFTAITKLTGFASDEAIYLIGTGAGSVNIKGLLLAGIIIGTLGVLDDVVISQIGFVSELMKANPELSRRELYKRAMNVGISHMAAMVNTLFLAYTGAALPLLILFSIKEAPFLSFSQVLNNEVVATEIVRTLTGSIGLILVIPFATILAAYYLKKKNRAPSAHIDIKTQ
jgi:uncharacterized membrane protein